MNFNIDTCALYGTDPSADRGVGGGFDCVVSCNAKVESGD
jgi:hypothetical protein